MRSRDYYMSEEPRFSRRWWLRGLRTLFWIALISVLIWLYADLEHSKEREFRATIRLNTGKSSSLV